MSKWVLTIQSSKGMSRKSGRSAQKRKSGGNPLQIRPPPKPNRSESQYSCIKPASRAEMTFLAIQLLDDRELGRWLLDMLGGDQEALLEHSLWGLFLSRFEKTEVGGFMNPLPRRKDTVTRNSERRIPRKSSENQRLFTRANLVVRPATGVSVASTRFTYIYSTHIYLLRTLPFNNSWKSENRVSKSKIEFPAIASI